MSPTRSTFRFAANRAIALSGYGMESDLTLSRAAGFRFHLTKPVSLVQLIGAIESLPAVPP